MKVVFVSGERDCAALDFEQRFKIEEVLEELEIGTTTVFESDQYYIEATLFEFEEVDPTFIDFIRNNIQEHDYMKHTNFYIVEE